MGELVYIECLVGNMIIEKIHPHKCWKCHDPFPYTRWPIFWLPFFLLIKGMAATTIPLCTTIQICIHCTVPDCKKQRQIKQRSRLATHRVDQHASSRAIMEAIHVGQTEGSLMHTQHFTRQWSNINCKNIIPNMGNATLYSTMPQPLLKAMQWLILFH